ncbi:MAG: cysteine--tRNA ligase [Candidatus Tectomicrobia bacterium]|nr:cysteine--tRNA ligase [Candidatus Tectomicrobia bacterium]
MPLVIYNTRTRRKEPFQPLEPGVVRLYVCGITAYDACHVGHARSAVVFDLIVRYFCWQGYRVRYVRNFTDVDDKIILRSRAENVPSSVIAERYIQEYREDMAALGVLTPEHEPTVSGHMRDIIAMIEVLLKKGYAYQANGDVYFSVEKFPRYGELSGRQLDEMLSGARVEANEAKANPLDFALWKGAKPGEPTWESPWGAGRPGWHIECSAMSHAYLGAHFDIHGGGKDLLFPHHENEVAQSQAASGQPFVNFWVHNGFVNIQHEKMSKSLGNFLTVRSLLERYHPEVIRLFLISTHYRSPVDYTEEAMATAKKNLDYFYTLLQRLDAAAAAAPAASTAPGGAGERQAAAGEEGESVLRRKFGGAMDNDFNSAAALAALFEASTTLNARLDRGELEGSAAAAAELREVGGVLGIMQRQPLEYLRWQPALGGARVTEEWVAAQLERRNAARRARDYAEADRIRDELQARGIIVEDSKDGTQWRRSG